MLVTKIHSGLKDSEKNYDLGIKLFTAMFVFEYLQPVHYFPLIGVLRLGMLLQIAITIYLITNLPFKISQTGYCLIGFLLLMAIGIPSAYNGAYAFGMTKYMVKMFLCLVLPIMFFANNLSRFKRFIRIFILLNIIGAIAGILQGGTGTGHFLADENDLSLALNIILPFIYFRAHSSEASRARVFYWVSFFIVLSANIATFSRGGFIGLIPTLFYCVWHTPNKKNIIIIGFVTIILACFTVSPEYWKEMGSISTESHKTDTGEVRMYSWKLGWRMFLDTPILGAGANNYNSKNHLYQGDEKGHSRRNMWGRAAHSMYFQLLPELGISGVIFFVYLLRLFYINNKTARKLLSKRDIVLLDIQKNKNDSDKYQSEKFFYFMALSLNGGMIGLLSTGIFISVLYYPHFWILLAMSGSMLNAARIESGRKSNV